MDMGRVHTTKADIIRITASTIPTTNLRRRVSKLAINLQIGDEITPLYSVLGSADEYDYYTGDPFYVGYGRPVS